MLRRGDLRLIERNGQDLMLAVVADVAGAEQPVVGGLVLQIERPVLRVRQLVVDVIAAEQERTKAVARGIICPISVC